MEQPNPTVYELERKAAVGHSGVYGLSKLTEVSVRPKPIAIERQSEFIPVWIKKMSKVPMNGLPYRTKFRRTKLPKI